MEAESVEEALKQTLKRLARYCGTCSVSLPKQIQEAMAVTAAAAASVPRKPTTAVRYLVPGTAPVNLSFPFLVVFELLFGLFTSELVLC